VKPIIDLKLVFRNR